MNKLGYENYHLFQEKEVYELIEILWYSVHVLAALCPPEW